MVILLYYIVRGVLPGKKSNQHYWVFITGGVQWEGGAVDWGSTM